MNGPSHHRIPNVCALIVFAICVFSSASPSWTQLTASQLSPSEAFSAAMDPFNQARAQNNDLTEADTLALSLGMTRAARDCTALSAVPQQFAGLPSEKLALGRLCIFGQQFEQARAALLEYLVLPAPPERETALVLLARAFLGLGESQSAYAQVLFLLSDYPYDAQIHLAADLVISANEGWNSEPEKEWSAEAADLCQKQRDATLPLLAQGNALFGKEGNVPASQLYADALRCVVLARSLGDHAAEDTLQQLVAIPQQPNWQNTAELPLMQEALARATMLGQPTPLAALHAHQINAAGTLSPRLVSLRRGAVILAAFTLWSPSAAEQLRALALSSPPHTIYALTSWSANTGGVDAASPRIAAALLALKKTFPAPVPLLIVPEAELQAFHTDRFPAGIAIRDGVVVSNSVLADEGAVRMTLGAARTTGEKQ